MRTAEQTWKQYLKIPSVEIWNSTVIDNALRQIFAVWRLGLFASPDDAHRVCDSLAELLTHVEAQALVGKKLHPFMPPPARENYKLFYTETGINNNTILMKTDRQTVSYIAQNELNYIRTDNDLFNQHLEHWFTRLIGSAELISQANHDLRQRFFLEQTDNIAFVKAQIS